MNSEWQALAKKRQELLRQSCTLECRLKNLSAEPDMHELLNKRDVLRQKAEQLQNKIRHADSGKKPWFLTRLLQGLKKGAAQLSIQDQIEYLEQQLEGLERYRRTGLMPPTKEAEDYIKKKVTAMRKELALLKNQLRKQTEEKREKKEEFEPILGMILAAISKIDEHYQRTKKCLESMVAKARQDEKQQYREILSWAAQDHDHMMWMFENQSAHAEQAMWLYRQQFPADNIDKPLPQELPLENKSPEPPPPRIRKEKTDAAVKTFQVVHAPSQNTWNFFIVHSPTDPGKELTGERQHFLERLALVFNQTNYRNLSTELVFEKLCTVTGMEVAKRQRLKEVGHGEFRGWKVVKIAGHRIFLSIDETHHRIRLIIRQRKEAYKGT